MLGRVNKTPCPALELSLAQHWNCPTQANGRLEWATSLAQQWNCPTQANRRLEWATSQALPSSGTQATSLAQHWNCPTQANGRLEWATSPASPSHGRRHFSVTTSRQKNAVGICPPRERISIPAIKAREEITA
jgi:hypothetical protein